MPISIGDGIVQFRHATQIFTLRYSREGKISTARRGESTGLVVPYGLQERLLCRVQFRLRPANHS